MTDNPDGSAHQNDDLGVQENPQENISSDPQTENPPLDKATPEAAPENNVSGQEPSVEHSDSVAPDSNRDAQKSVAEEIRRLEKKSDDELKRLVDEGLLLGHFSGVDDG